MQKRKKKNIIKEFLGQLKARKNKKTVQNTIPFLKAHSNGIFEIEKGVYSKTLIFNDINYQIAKQDEQENIFLRYGELLNYYDSSVGIQITTNNKSINRTEFEESILLPDKEDNLRKYRREYNSMLKKQAREGGNDIQCEKYITITIEANSIKEAEAGFSKIISETLNNIKRLGSNGRELTTEERLKVLHDFYNPGVEDFDIDLESLKKSGLTEKDAIAPDSMVFKGDYMKFGDKYARSLYLKKIPAFLGDTFLKNLTDFKFHLMTTLNIYSVAPEDAIKLVTHIITSIKQDKMEQQKRAFKNGYSADMVDDNTENSLNEAKELLDDLINKNQKMFFVNLLIVHIADSLEELNRDTDLIMSTARKSICQVGKLSFQQEDGLNSVLPLGNDKINIKRTLTTESTAIFLPFTSQELVVKNGVYYGLNAVTYNLVMFDRKQLKNPNGFYLGTPGSGKSFSSKREVVNVLLSTDDDVLIIDPEKEYVTLANNFGGEVIDISASSSNHINPLDMDKDYADDEDPLVLKSEFIMSLCDLVIGIKSNISAKQKSIIDRCIKSIYMPYIDSGYNPDLVPTLNDFYEALKNQNLKEAEDIALSLELYIKGSLSVFANKSNVNIKNRFVVFDISKLGKQLKNMGLLICLDAVWNRVIENRKRGKRTWMYFDEAHLLFKNEYSANFLYELYKRARKWGGIPTGITQNVEELLDSDTARKMLSNSDFIVMLNQAPIDRQILADILNISETQLNFITNAPAGQGLLFVGDAIIPFIDRFPTNTELYKMMTTKPEEIIRS